MLFKLILLERKVLFFISPVEKLCETMIGLISLFPRLLEEGLMEAAAYSRPERLEDDSSCDVDDLDFERVPESGDVTDSVFPEKGEEESKEKKNMKNRFRSKLQRGFDAVRGAIPVAEEADSETLPRVFTLTLLTDSYGFPLSIFTKGNLFHPYLSISYLDMIRSNTVRAYTIGATNALFRHRCDLVDVSITIDDATGELQLDLSDPELKRQLVLSTADLRFGDFLQKTVEARRESLGTSWDGGDEWLRLQFRAYLLSLMATVRSGLSAPLADFNEAFVEAWQNKHNFLIWSGSDCPDLANSVPGHPFAGQLSMSDVLLRVEHTIGFEPGRRVANVVASGSKYVSDTSRQLKSGISSWLKKPPSSS